MSYGKNESIYIPREWLKYWSILRKEAKEKKEGIGVYVLKKLTTGKNCETK